MSAAPNNRAHLTRYNGQPKAGSTSLSLVRVKREVSMAEETSMAQILLSETVKGVYCLWSGEGVYLRVLVISYSRLSSPQRALVVPHLVRSWSGFLPG